MKQHDYKNLPDALCVHVDCFAELLDLWRRRNLGEWTCFKLARDGAQKRYPLEPDEAEAVGVYIESRFGEPKSGRDPQGLPVPMMVVF